VSVNPVSVDRVGDESAVQSAAPRHGAVAALVAGAVAMGISPIFVRFADVGPFASAFWRVGLALPLLYGWMRFEERQNGVSAPFAFRRSSFSRASVLAGIAFAGDLFFWHLAILKTTVANATFLATLAPLVVVLITWLVLRRQVARSILVGLALCVAGGAALIGHDLTLDPARLNGDLFGLATALFFGLYFLAVEKARVAAGAARVTFEATLVTAGILFVVAMSLEPTLLPASRNGALALIAMAWLSHAGGQGLLSVALGRLPAVFSSLVIFLEAIAAAIFGWIILGEALTSLQGMGGVLILAGIWLARPADETTMAGGTAQ